MEGIELINIFGGRYGVYVVGVAKWSLGRYDSYSLKNEPWIDTEIPVTSRDSVGYSQMRWKKPRGPSVCKTVDHRGHSYSLCRFLKHCNGSPSQFLHDLAHGLGSHPLSLVLWQTSAHVLDGLELPHHLLDLLDVLVSQLVTVVIGVFGLG